MIPLCTPTTSDSTGPDAEPLQIPLTWGCAFTWLGSPCVAQRVWPIPQQPGSAWPLSVFSARLRSLPVDFTTSARSLPLRTASPAESYPRYSSLERPSRRTGAASLLPVYPTIPHISCLLFYRYLVSSGGKYSCSGILYGCRPRRSSSRQSIT